MSKFIFLLLVSVSLNSFGAEVDNSLLKKNLDAANLQIEVMKAQIEVMKGYQDKILSTVYWALGCVLSIVILMVGYGWFSNYKNQEAEINSIRDAVDIKLKVIENGLSGDLKKYKTELIDYLKNGRDDLTTSYEFDRLEREFELMSLSIMELEYDKWASNGNGFIATRMAATLINKSIKVGVHEHKLSSYVGLLIDGLKSIKDANTTLSIGLLSTVTACIKNIEENSSIDCTTIKKLSEEVCE